MRILLKKNEGYMLVEIILASVLAFGVAYFILSLTIKLKNKNDDLMVKTEIKTDQSIITNKLMNYIIDSDDMFDCDSLIVNDDEVTYKGKLIDKLSDYAKFDSSQIKCASDDDNVRVFIPIDVQNQLSENFDVDLFYKKKKSCLTYDDIAKKDLFFSYDGEYEVIDDCQEENGECKIVGSLPGDWEIKFKTSGILKFNEEVNIDAFLVGGGGAGGSTLDWDSNNGGMHVVEGKGSGGGGGYVSCEESIQVDVNDITVKIGAGGQVKDVVERTGLYTWQLKEFDTHNGGNSSFGNLNIGGGHVGNPTYYYTAQGWGDGMGGAGGSGGGGAGGGAGGQNGASGSEGKLCYWFSGNGGYSRCSTMSGGAGNGFSTHKFCDSSKNDIIYASGGTGTPYLKGYVPNGKEKNSGDGGDGHGNGATGVVIIRNARDQRCS